MGIIKISDNVYSVGVLNPSLRVFDIVMEAKYGTSYNAYLISDNNKTILIDTVHPDFLEQYLYNVQCLSDVSNIDYIIMNHTELDHSGSLEKIIELNPEIVVICTPAAQKYLKKIINKDFKCKTVKHGDKIKTGKLELDFIVSPFLHWPDSMMTYLNSNRVLFSCDFLGCHFCEATMLEENMHYREEYLNEFTNYYEGLFSPFKKYVLDGIDKIKPLEILYLCPSHGPIITEGIANRILDYEKWSKAGKLDNKKIIIFYASAYGCTEKIAYLILNALKKYGENQIEIFDVLKTSKNDIIQEIKNSKRIFVGSCTINKDAPKIIWDILTSIDAISSRGKIVGVFGSYGWSGEAIKMISQRLDGIGCNVVGDGIRVNFNPSSEDTGMIENYVKQFINSK